MEKKKGARIVRCCSVVSVVVPDVAVYRVTGQRVCDLQGSSDYAGGAASGHTIWLCFLCLVCGSVRGSWFLLCCTWFMGSVVDLSKVYLHS